MVMEELSIYLYKLTRLLVISLLSLSIYYLINIGNNYVDKEKKLKIKTRVLVGSLLGLLATFLLYKLFKKYGILSDTFYTIVLSIILAYLFNPLVNYLEDKGIKKRSRAVLLIYLGILGLILIFAFLIIPKLGRELKNFAINISVYMNRTSLAIDRLVYNYEKLVGEIPFISENLKATVANGIEAFQKIFINGMKSFFNIIINMSSKVLGLVLTPILTFYFLVDKDLFIRKALGLIPEKHLDDAMLLFREMDDSLSKFVRGRIIMAAYVGISITLVLLILGVDFAVPVGLITGFADIIPYIGPFLGFVPAVFFALIEKPIKALWVSILFLLIQWTENNILAPKVIGESTGLHPMLVLLCIVVGGGMFGVMGMIFSVPVVAVGIILFKFIKNRILEIKSMSN